jgi:hypothetical protein
MPQISFSVQRGNMCPMISVAGGKEGIGVSLAYSGSVKIGDSNSRGRLGSGMTRRGYSNEPDHARHRAGCEQPQRVP